MSKIVFFDIDGTLIDPEKKRITDNTKKALLKLKEMELKSVLQQEDRQKKFQISKVKE